MAGRYSRRAVSPLRATLFAVGLGVALIFVVSPSVPGSAEGEIGGDDVAAVTMISLLAGGALGLYLHLFQPRELDSVLRLFMLALLTVVWVAAAKFFLSITLPDNDRLFLSYMLPVALMSPTTSRVLTGDVVPMPTLPVEVTLIRSPYDPALFV